VVLRMRGRAQACPVVGGQASPRRG
jgi:hypothetical protein